MKLQGNLIQEKRAQNFVGNSIKKTANSFTNDEEENGLSIFSLNFWEIVFMFGVGSLCFDGD